MFFHKPVPVFFPQDPLARWTADYKIHFEEESAPEVFFP